VIAQLLAAFLGFALAYALLPSVVAVARKLRLLDVPDHARRVHLRPVPRLGGVAIAIATVVGAGAAFLFGQFEPAYAPQPQALLPGLIIGGAIVFATGVVDDLRGVTPTLKLVAQIVAALAVIAYGFRIDRMTIGIGSSDLVLVPWVGTALTVLWIVGMTNAFNLIDGIDGLAGTFALIGLFTAFGVDFYLNQGTSPLVVTSAMIGAVLAFLRFNLPPARIFLGDSGSMLLGYFLSIRLVMSATTPTKGLYVLVPLFALAYPIADTFIAMARRWLRGHPFSRADGRHVHHRILALGISPRRTLILLAAFFTGVAAMGVAVSFAPPRVVVAFGTAAVVLVFCGLFYGIRWLRYNEFVELGASVASVVVNARAHVRNKIVAGEVAARLPTARSLEELNVMLNECALELGFVDVAVVPSTQNSALTTHRISPLDRRPFRVDYPIAWEDGGKVYEVVLRLWCERPDPRRHIGAERIASRLAPAIESWLRATPPTSIAVVTEHRA
jgi:UDP-GlcNAc:undecaprenyl-phosphate GlcNAc-1-phosphate transferase